VGEGQGTGAKEVGVAPLPRHCPGENIPPRFPWRPQGLVTTGAATKLGVAFTTAQRAIERLERAGIFNRMGKAKRGRVYCARALMDILEEPAQLRPVARNRF